MSEILSRDEWLLACIFGATKPDVIPALHATIEMLAGAANGNLEKIKIAQEEGWFEGE